MNMIAKINFEFGWALLAVVMLFGILIAHGAMANESGAEMERANASFANGDFESAKEQFLELERVAPKDVAVLRKIALLYLLENNASLSQSYYEKVIENSSAIARAWPNSLELYLDTALAYFRGDDFARAAVYLGKAAGPMGVTFIDEIAVAQRQLEMFQGLDPYIISGKPFVEIPFVQLDPLPVVLVSVNGSEPLKFVIDTGAEEITIDTSVAQRLGVENVGGSSLQKGAAAGSGAMVQLGKIDRIQLGGLGVQNIPVDILDMGPISERVFEGTLISGSIGTRFLMHFLSSIDYKNQQLILRQKTIENRMAFETRLSGIAHKTIPISMYYTHLILARGSFNRQNEGLYVVDTGVAGAGLLSSEEKFESSGVLIDWSKSEVGAGVGGEAEALQVQVNEVALGAGANKVIRSNVPGVLLREDLGLFGGGLGFEIQGLISHSLFKGAVVSFDFESMELIVEE